MELMNRLGKINNYVATRDPPKGHETVLLDNKSRIQLASTILSSHPAPYAYSQHLAYLNFTEMELPKPIYINLIRDPIERVISWHYYIRSRFYYEDLKAKLGDKAPAMPDDEFFKLDLDTCVKTDNPYCQFTQGSIVNKYGDYRRQTLFFCGQNKMTCLPFNSRKAMQQAKRTVEEEYAVVGTWEDTNITLTVLEKYIPKFFRHAKVAYYLGHDRLSSVNKSKVKKTVSKEVRDILRKNFTREIEFYDFCKQRLYKQYAAITSESKEDDEYVLMTENDDED